MAAIGGFRFDLPITRKTDGNFGNVSSDVLFFKVAYNENGGNDAQDKTIQWFHLLCAEIRKLFVISRYHEHIPHTWATSNDNLFQSNFSARSNCEAILGKTPDWPI